MGTERLFVSTSGDCTFAVARLASGELVLDDVERGERLGPVIGDCAMFYVEIDGEPHIIFAGAELEGAHHVDLELPREPLVARVGNGVWISRPTPFEPGMIVAVTWRDEAGRELRSWTTLPLDRRNLEPHPDAAWLGFAPG